MNRFSLFLLSFILVIGSLQKADAAGPVTHAYLAQKWNRYQAHYKAQDSDAFMCGTLFPDIRYLGVIKREATHVEHPTLKAIAKESSPFESGKTLHAFVDEEREKIVEQWDMYQHLNNVPGQKYKTIFLKLLEDEILFQKQDWAHVKQALELVDEHEKNYEINDESLLKWHKLLINAFTVSPSEHLASLAKRDKYLFDVPPKVVRRWSKILPTLAKDPFIQRYVNHLDNHFDNLFKMKEKV